MANKFTEKDYLNNIIEVFTTGESSIAPEDMIAYANKKIDQINHKNEKAKERAAVKREEADELYDRIKEVLSDEPMTVAEIVIALNDDNVTAGKVSYRCSKMAANNDITKTFVKIAGEGKARTLVAYTK